MKTTMKVVLAFMILLSFSSMVACENKDKTAAKKIVKYLQDKYGEEFVVDGIGGGYGTITSNTLKAEVYPKNAPDKKFNVEITKDLKTVWDSYMNVIMAEKLNMMVYDKAKSLFGGLIWATSSFDSGGLSFPDPELKNRDIHVKDYEYDSALIDIFVQRDSRIETGKEAVQIDQFMDELLSEGIKDALVSVFYIPPEEFDKVQATYTETDNIYDYFRADKRALNFAMAEITKSKKMNTVEDIKNDFEFK